MATFDPQLPAVSAPDWTNVTKPISQPEADKSTGLTLATSGQALTGIADLAEEADKGYIKDKVASGVDAIRDTSTAAYESIRRAQLAGVPPDPRAVGVAGFTGSLMPQPGTDVPDGVQAGIDKAQNLALAKGQNGTNDTLYTSALNSLTKQLRAEFPGHRDFIDEQISKISGKNPANAYMDNLLTDIRQGTTGTGANKLQTEILTKAAANFDDPEVQKYYVANMQGVPNAFGGLTQAVFNAETRKAKYTQFTQTRDMNNANKADDADLAQRQYGIIANQTVSAHLDPVVDIPGLTTPQKMSELIEASLAGKTPITTDQKNGILGALSAARKQAMDDLQSKAINGGFGTRVNDPAKLKAIQDQAIGYFDRSIDLINNDKYGSLFELRRRASAMQDDTTNEVLSSPDIGQFTLRRAVFKDKLGDNWLNYLDSLGMDGKKLNDLKSFINDNKVAASAPPDLRTQEGTRSFQDALIAAKKAKANGAKAPDAVYDNLADNVNLILKANETGRQDIAKNVVDYMFDPQKNSNIMGQFGRDYTDSNGQYHKGKFAVYDNLTKPQITDSIYALKDPASWGKYKDWQENSFTTLFGEEARNLNSLQAKSASNQPVGLAWDSDNNRFMLTGPAIEKINKMRAQGTPMGADRPVSDPDLRYALEAERSIYALNSGLKNLSYMHAKGGEGTTSEYLFNMLMGMGYSPNDQLHGDNLPQRAIQAIQSSQMKKPTIQDVDKAIQ